MSNLEKIIVGVLFLLVSGVAFLFVLEFQINDDFSKLETTKIPSSSPEETTSSATINRLENKIDDLVASSSALLKRVEKLEETPVAVSSPKATTATFQRQIIHLGSANTTKQPWTDSGVEIKLNSADYPSSVSAVFEVGLSIIGGEAWARLINKTTGSIMAITEISHASSTTTWKNSPSFKLHNGNNTYALQLRSTGGELAIASGAKIILEN